MTRLEGTEKTVVPEIIITELLEQFKMLNINPVVSPELITYHMVRDLLKKVKYSHAFENVTQIIRIVTMQPMKSLSPLQKNTLIQCFEEIQIPYGKFKGKRKNFLSYSYIMYKFCEMLGYTYWLNFLKLFDTDQKMLQADQIWKNICIECGYTFIETDVMTNRIRARSGRKRRQHNKHYKNFHWLERE